MSLLQVNRCGPSVIESITRLIFHVLDSVIKGSYHAALDRLIVWLLRNLKKRCQTIRLLLLVNSHISHALFAYTDNADAYAQSAHNMRIYMRIISAVFFLNRSGQWILTHWSKNMKIRQHARRYANMRDIEHNLGSLKDLSIGYDWFFFSTWHCWTWRWESTA